MHKILFTLLLTFSLSLCHGQYTGLLQDSGTDNSQIKRYPKWTLWLPGATHFYDGHVGRGLWISTLTLGSAATGIIYKDELRSGTNSQYANYPLLLAMSTYGMDKTHYYQKELAYIKDRHPRFRYDPIAFNELLKAPFRPKNIFTPLTGGVVGFALAQLYISHVQSDISFGQVDRFQFFDRYIGKERAIPFYGLVAMTTNWSVGISEEYMFRNYLMPILDYEFGQKTGLLVSSGIFGAGHALNYLFVEDPDPWDILLHVSSTTVLGYAFGKNVQNNDYRISQAVAAHAWYNFTLMLGSFLVNPRENVFGVNIKVSLN